MKHKDRKIKYLPNELKDTSHFIHNFDVSVVMPFYKKMKEFRRVLPKNLRYFQRNGIEIVIVMDEDSEEEELTNFIQEYPFVNWKVVVNHFKHNWRNPAKAINVGLRNASNKYILVCSPESEFITDGIYLMRKQLEYFPKHFAIGTVAFLNLTNKHSENSFFIPYGSIMAKRKYFFKIGGYDETLIKWGGDDNNIRIRLEMNGIRKLFLPEVKLIHRERDIEIKKRKGGQKSSIPVEVLKNILLPNEIQINQNKWGNDFSDIAYSWKDKKFNKDSLMKYLYSFKEFDLPSDNFFQSFKSILLVQCYNEKELIKKFLNHNSQYFDAIILLDDDSDDETYEMSTHSKIILKVKKKRTFFNDLENRNILLRLVSFFNCKWICFLDVDEIIDKRFADFSFMESDNVYNVLFNLVHLWDSEEYYNAEYPFSNKGIQQHFRMFRNIGNTQITTNKSALHFKLTPYIKSVFKSRILLLHYGNISKEKRWKKYKMYQLQDKHNDQASYEHIICNPISLNRINDIII